MNKLKLGSVLLLSCLVISLASAEDNAARFKEIRKAIEENKPVYTDAYAKNIKGVTYSLGMQDGFLVPPAHNLGLTSRKNFDGNKLLGYFKPGASVVFYVDGRAQREFSIVEKGDNVFEIGNAKVTLKTEMKDLPVLPFSEMNEDKGSSYTKTKVYYVTMNIVPLGGVEAAAKVEEPTEWFDPTLRYNYEQQVKDLKRQYLTGVDLDELSKNEKEIEIEYLARKISAERRELGKKYKAATPEYYRKKIFKRNIDKYGDQYGPTISYLRNVQGKSWKEIIESAVVPGGEDLWYTKVSSKLGEFKHKIGNFFSGNQKEAL